MPGRSVAEVQADPEFQSLPPASQQRVLKRIMAAGAAQYQGAPDEPLESPLIDPVDFVPGGIGGKAGAQAGGALARGPLRGLFRYRLGTNPGHGLDQVAETVAKTAPPPLRPKAATVEALSETMRSGSGKKALSESRERGLDALRQELGAAEQSAVTQVPGRTDRFNQLTTELANANRAAYNPATADPRTGILSLQPQRERAAILREIQETLSPEQWTRFQGLQDEYAKGSDLLRLFKSTRANKDVLTDQASLQARGRHMQEKLDPELLRSIFRGGPPTTMDHPATIPLGLSKLGQINIPGTVMAGPPSRLQTLLMQLFGGATGAATELGIDRLSGGGR